MHEYLRIIEQDFFLLKFIIQQGIFLKIFAKNCHYIPILPKLSNAVFTSLSPNSTESR